MKGLKWRKNNLNKKFNRDEWGRRSRSRKRNRSRRRRRRRRKQKRRR